MIGKSVLVGGVAILSFAFAGAATWVVGGVGTPARASPQEPTAAAAPNDPDATFYVVAYDWGWGAFTADGTEVDKIRVTQGTSAEIYAVNKHAAAAIDKLPAAVATAIRAVDWEGRTKQVVEAGRIPLPEGMAAEQALGMGHEDEEDGHDEAAEAEAAEGHDDGDAEAAGTDRHDEDAEAEADAHDDEEAEADAHDDEEATDPVWQDMEDHGFLIPWHGVTEYLSSEASNPIRVVFTADRPGEYEFVCTNFCGLGHDYMAQTMLVVE